MGLEETQLKDEDFTSMQQEGRIKIDDFRNGANGKYISIVSDSEHLIEENSRYKYLASYIEEKNNVTNIKLQRFKKEKEGWLSEVKHEITLPFKQANSLTDFLKFLEKANLGTLSSGKFILSEALSIDENLYSKLVTLSRDVKGQETLSKLFNEGYLTSDLDIPDLVKKGLSRNKIEEKNKKLKDFEELINKSEVKEVSDIQKFLKDNPWVFGPEYKTLDFRDAGFAGNPDGRLLRIDGLSDILEVKLPSEELLRIDDQKRQFISPKLAEALGQLTGYLEYYYSEYSHERDDNSGDEIIEDRYGKYYKPKGILLIGRRGKEMINTTSQTISAEPKNMRRLLSYFHWVEVLTYDDLLERSRNGLDNLLNS